MDFLDTFGQRNGICDTPYTFIYTSTDTLQYKLYTWRLADFRKQGFMKQRGE